MPIPAAGYEEEEVEQEAWSAEERAKELAALDSQEKEFLREVGKHNLYIFAKGILGYPDVSAYAHKELCEEVCREDGHLRRLFLMPRAHLKSSLITIADSIRLVIRDPDNTAILIASETATQAQKFLKEIKNHWMKNDLLRDLYPELVPEKFTGPGVDWSDSKASLRVGISRQSHWETIGVGGAPTGNHYTRIKNDDLIGLEAYRSQATMQRTKDWNDSIEPLLTKQAVDIIDWVGTRWAKNDLYEHIMEFFEEALGVYTRAAIEDGEIIFPELHTWEEYERLQRKNPALWFAQYENNPIHGGPEDLPYGSIQSYYLTPDYQEVVIRLSDGTDKRWKVADLDRVITVDPNSGSPVAPDMAAVHVSGLSPDDETFALESWSDRCDPYALCHKTLELSRRWKPRVVGIEKAGQQNTEFYFNKLAKEQNFHVRTEPLLPKGRDKEERIRYYMQPIIASGKYFMLPSQSVLRQQIKDFPHNLIIDELDATAYAQEIHRRPAMWKSPAEKHRVLKLVMGGRNPRTGY